MQTTLASRPNEAFVTPDGQSGVILRLLDEKYAYVRYDFDADDDSTVMRVAPRTILLSVPADDEIDDDLCWDDIAAHAPMI